MGQTPQDKKDVLATWFTFIKAATVQLILLPLFALHLWRRQGGAEGVEVLYLHGFHPVTYLCPGVLCTYSEQA